MKTLALALMASALLTSPAAAADGDRIVYARDGTIYTARPDGSGTKRIAHPGGETTDPVLSPDGRTIAFASDRGDYPAKQGIYVMRASDGSHMRRITKLAQEGAYDRAPRFTPDGRRIIFTRTRIDRGQDVAALCVTTLRGKVRRLTPWAAARPGASTADVKRLAEAALAPRTATASFCLVATLPTGRAVDLWYCVVWVEAPAGVECKAVVLVRAGIAVVGNPVTCAPARTPIGSDER